ncbi:MAG TPA: hypothetical protein VI461_17385 [Chitinophagaceae bacterium]|nr:hypothetical protein [Chitinophagaceae bacterium]
MKFSEKIVPQPVIDLYKHYKNLYTAGQVRKKWELAGKPVPPPHIIKQQAIRYYQKKSGYNILVETGTYKGDMILAQLDSFEKIYSIELSKGLFENAKKRFQKNSKVMLLHGNSGEVITKVLQELKEPAIFWLDGHYSGSITAKTEKYSPVIEELQALINHNQLQHIILVDDARGFTGEHGYPTIEEMKELAAKNFSGYHFSVDEDIIRLVPEKFG